MTKQPEALRLVNLLEGDYDPDWLYEIGVDQAAAELLRLYVVNQEMLEALRLADFLFMGANMNEQAVMRKVRAAIATATGEKE